MQPATAAVSALDTDSALLRLRPATRVAALPLALATCLTAPSPVLPLILALLVLILKNTGSTFVGMIRTVRTWAPMGGLVLLVHALTTTEGAPMWHPSWLGVVHGAVALGRIASATCCLALALRCTPLDDLVDGLHWWLRPWRRLGVETAYLGLVLAVALGTAPGVLAEGRRIESVVRLRRGRQDREKSGLRRWWRRILDRAHVVVPLLEGIVRRVDGVTLAVRNRLPQPRRGGAGPAPVEGLVLVLWLLLVVATATVERWAP